MGRRHRRRRPQLRPGLEPRAGRVRRAPPRRTGDRRQELRPDPPDEPDRAGDPAAHVRRRGGLRARRRRATSGRFRAFSTPFAPAAPSSRHGPWPDRSRSSSRSPPASARSCSPAASSPTPRAREPERRAVLGGCALGLATGWNVANTGAVAQPLASAYGVGLATVGLFTTALFVTHLALQIPAGKASDRFGPRRVGLLGLVVIAVFSAIVADRARYAR